MALRNRLRLILLLTACALALAAGLVGSGRAASNGNVTLHIAVDSSGVASMTVPYQKFGDNGTPVVDCTGSGNSQPDKTVASGGTATIGIQNFNSVLLGAVASSTGGYTLDRWTSGTATTDSGVAVTGSPNPCLSGSTSGVNGNITDLYAHFMHVNQAPSAPGTPSGTSPNNGAFTLGWTASSDPDGDTVTYTLEHERSDAVSFTEVASGISGASYQFTSGSKEAEGRWTYRVKGCDASLCSGYSSVSSVVVVDRSAPSAPTVATNRAPDYTGSGNWWADSVTITWTATGDPLLADGTAGSGVTSVTAPKTITTQGSFSETGTATDAVGNVSSGTTKTGNVDTTAPVLTPTATSNGAAYSSGTWANHDVVVHFGCTDTGGSGVASTTADATISTEGSGQFAPGTCTDNVGKTDSESFTNIQIDKTAPVVGTHADVTAEATSASGATVTFTAPTATDNLGGSGLAGSVSCLPASGSTFALGSTTVTCTIYDQAGNSGSSQFSVTVQDTTAPVIASHDDVTAEATSASGAVVNYTPPNATDAVKGTFAATCAPASGSTFALGSTTVTCNATDDAGNHAIATTFKVKVQDTTAPALTVPSSNVTAEATSATGAPVTYSVSATDAVDPLPTITCKVGTNTVLPGDKFPIGDTTVTCTASDASGNTSDSKSFHIVVSDTTPPTIDSHADVIAEATSASGAVVTYTAPNAHDAVDGTFPATCTPASGSTFALGDTTVTCDATDTAGNHATATTFKVKVQDTTPPTLTVPASNVTAEATSATGAAVTYSVSATDAIDPLPTIECKVGAATVLPGDTFALGDTTVTCTASDASGNTSAPKSFHVVVSDTTPPTLTVPTSNVTAEATSPSGAAVTYSATASDTVDASPIVTCKVGTNVVHSGDTFPIADTTVTCTASDHSGNTSDPKSFHILVSDSTAPALTVPSSNVTAEATSASGAPVTYTVSATDAGDASPIVTCKVGTNVVHSGDTFPIADTTVTCTASDHSGNTSAPKSFHIIVSDTTAPVIAAHADVVAEATSASGAVVNYTPPNATDAVKGTFAATCSPAPGTTFAIGNTTVTCNATDDSGNHATATTFKVTVQDTTAPALTVPSANVTGEATGPTGAAITYSVSATDAVDPSPTVTCKVGTTVVSSGDMFPIGTTTVSCTASDASGNMSAAKTFDVVVTDTVVPTSAITFAANNGVYSASTFAGGCASAAADLCGTASDNASGVAKVEVRIQRTSDARYWNGSSWVVASTWVQATGATSWSYAFAPGSDVYALNVRATDVSGNVQATPASASFTVDATAPTSAVTFGASGASYTPANYDAGCGGGTADVCGTASDGTGAGLAKVEVRIRRADGMYWNGTTWVAAETWNQATATTSWSYGVGLAEGSYTVTSRATDTVGNVETAGTGNAFFVDATAPVVSAHVDVQAEATSASGAAVTFTGPTASDAVDAARSVSCSPSSGSNFPLGVSTVTCSATDRAGNTGSSSFHVTVGDTTPPTVASHLDVHAEAANASGATVHYTAPTASDLVDGTVSTSCLPSSGTTFALGTTTVTCTAVDAHLNSATGTFAVIVSDTTPPNFAPALNVTAGSAGAGGAIVYYSAPGATDTVDGTTTTTCVPPSGSLFPPGTTTVTCTSNDAHGNTSTTTFTVTVAAPGTMPPPTPGQTYTGIPTSGTVLVQLPGSSTFVPLTGPTMLPPGTIIDASGGTVELIGPNGDALVYSGTTIPIEALHGALSSAVSFPLSGRSYTPSLYVAGCGDATANICGTAATTAGAVARVEILIQRTSDGLYWNGSSWGATTTWLTADGTTNWSYSAPLGDGAYTITSRAVDGVGTAETPAAPTPFEVDGTPPTVTTPPPDVQVAAAGADGAIVSYSLPTATDAVDGPRTVTCRPPSGSTFPVGVTIVTCTASDRAGNITTFSFEVTVNAAALPPPVAGVSVNVYPTSGTILVKLPGTTQFVPLTTPMQLPVGTTIDATHGTLELVSADGDASFYGGIFVVQEPLTPSNAMRALSSFATVAGPRTTNLNLVGGNFRICTPKKRATFALDSAEKKPPKPSKKTSKKPVRHLWGNGKGHFRTKGRYSAATVRGTWWDVADRCDGTLTIVKRGVVGVQDFVRHRTVTVKAGHRYLAKKTAPKKRATAKKKRRG